MRIGQKAQIDWRKARWNEQWAKVSNLSENQKLGE